MTIIRIVLCLAFLAIGAFLSLRLRNTLRLTASTMECPNCGSQDVKIENRIDGITSTSGAALQRSLLMPNYRATAHGRSGTKIDRSRIAKCQKCGFDYPYWTADEIHALKRRATVKTVAIIIPLTVLTLMLIVAMFKPERDAAPDSVWQTSYTPLEDFNYYVEGNYIHLERYTGSNKKVWIAPAYNVDGVNKQVVSLDGTFALHSVSSVIVPEGITTLSPNTFNSCGVKYVYLPSSLRDFDGWSYFHDVDKLCYGGTESQWQMIYHGKRADLKAKQIVYDARIDSLIKSQ